MTLIASVLGAAPAAQDPRDCSLQGRITDVLGEPVPAASVQVLDPSRDAVLARSATDGEGLYQLARLPRDAELTVCIEAPGKVPVHAPSPPSGRVRLLHFVLEDAVALTGTVTDDAGRPIAGAMVVAVAGHHSTSAGTDAEGRYRLPAVPVGRVEVQAFGGGRGLVQTALHLAADATCDLRIPGGSRRARLLAAAGLPDSARSTAWFEVRGHLLLPVALQRLPLRGDGTAELPALPFPHEVKLVAPGFEATPRGYRCDAHAGDDLEFHVTAAPPVVPLTLHGALLDPEGRPAARVRVACRDRAGQRVGIATSGADGSFALAVPLAAHAHCQLGIEVEDWLLAGARGNQRDAAGWSWQAKTADPGQRFEIRFEHAAVLRGRLHDAAGTPLAFADVRIAHEVRTRGPGISWVGSASTDRLGQLDVRGLRPARYQLLARDRQGNLVETCVEVEAGKVAGLGPLEFTTCGSVTGRVTDAGGTPLAGVVVYVGPRPANADVRLLAGEWRATTDRAGRYRIVGLPAGSVTLHVAERAASDRIGEAEVTVAAGRTATLDIRIAR